MKICQYNIYFGVDLEINITDRMKNVCECILEQNADVVCLQEVLFTVYDQIVLLLSGKYPYIYPDPINELTSRYDTMILSVYPIMNSTTHKFDALYSEGFKGTTMGRDLKLVLITDNDSNKYYICTTHFESEFRDRCTRKIYQYTTCSDILYQIYQKTGIPIILCADTNVCAQSSQPFHEAFNYAKGWRDAWVEDGSSKLHEITFDSNTNPILKERYASMDNTTKQKFSSRLDRILHLSNMHMVDFKMFGTDENILLSDHYGITCTISNKKPEARGDYVPLVISHTDKKKINDPYNTRSIKSSGKKMF